MFLYFRASWVCLFWSTYIIPTCDWPPLSYLSIDSVKCKLFIVVLRVWYFQNRTKLEEYVCSHGIDPEHERCECVESQIPNSDTGVGVQAQHGSARKISDKEKDSENAGDDLG